MRRIGDTRYDVIGAEVGHVAGARQSSTASSSRLGRDLRDGTWDARHGHLRELHEYDVGYRLVVSNPC